MENNTKSQKVVLQLKRLEKSNGWIYSVLMQENKIICDTLEIETLYNLNEDIYRIYPLWNPILNVFDLLIYNRDKSINSKFVAKNHQKYKNINIRFDNNYVTVGVRSKEPLLNDSENMLKRLSNLVESYSLINTNVYFQLINSNK